MKGRNRAEPSLVAEALEALDRLVPPRDGQQASLNLATLQEDIVQTQEETSNIFDFQQLKKVANDLDWNATPRKSRDDSREIELHEKKVA